VTRGESGGPSDDRVPVSVRLGTVVPPEDPEDWRKPLTWVAAAGMLAPALLGLGWFVLAPPFTSDDPVPATWLLAAALVAGAVVTGATQTGPAWSFAATLGSGLFGGLLTLLLATAVSPEPAGIATPILVHAFVAGMAGVAGALVAATLMPTFSRMPSRARRGLAPGAIGIAVSALLVMLLFKA
jgi:hypothetical protein